MHSVFTKLQSIARENYDKRIMEEFAKFGDESDVKAIEELALKTQIVVKKSMPNYNHGFLIYSSLLKRLSTIGSSESPTLFDIGTARGFSALVMSKALNKSKKIGRVVSIDLIPHLEPRKWNCILDGDQGISRRDIVFRFPEHASIIFISGKSKDVLPKLHVGRIGFAFIDGEHRWRSLKVEIEYLESHQEKGDILLFDDYTPGIFPDVVRAVRSLSDKYTLETFGNSRRGYALMVKN